MKRTAVGIRSKAATATLAVLLFTDASAGPFADFLYQDNFEEPGPPTIDVAGSLTRRTTTLPSGGANAAERALVVHYLGTGKSIDSAPRRQVPFRSYFDACNTNTETPRMFVSITQADQSAPANAEHPRVGSLLELQYNPANRCRV